MTDEIDTHRAGDLATLEESELHILFNPAKVYVLPLPSGSRIEFPIRRLTLAEIVRAMDVLSALSDAFVTEADVGAAVAKVVRAQHELIVELLARSCGTTSRVMCALPAESFIDLAVAFFGENRDFFDRVRTIRNPMQAAASTMTTPAPVSGGAALPSDLSATATT
ncbi:MAG: hypothetical protein ACOYB0_08240 [Polynucleobacter sp.]